MILLDTFASCGWIWSRSFHSRIICSRNNSLKSLILILEQLMKAEACTSVPGISWRPSIADRLWDDQQSSHRELSCMSARRIFLAVELLLWVKALYSRTAARNKLNCRGSRPHSRMTHHEGVVSLTIRILLSTVISHFCEGLSISLPCRKNGVAQTWLAYSPAGIAYVLKSYTQMCNLFVRSCSGMNCLMRKVPAVNGRGAASAAVFKLICLSQTMPRYLKESV